MFDVPILYIVFNRPENTKQSFEVIRQMKPARLYISADGPRNNRPDDLGNTQKVRSIVSNVDWDCKVFTLFHDSNLGCRRAIERALKWFFENEEEGIINEDDIVANKAFFEFCKIMLNRYRDDHNVFSINGCSVGYQNKKIPYGVTRYFNMWGWATWRRSYQLVQDTWKDYTPEVPLIKDKNMKKALHLPLPLDGNKKWLIYWQKIFNEIYDYTLDTWDYQWIYTVLKTQKLCINPSDNYVINTGFGETATHHHFTVSPICNLGYTSDTFHDKLDFYPKIDFKFEIHIVARAINDNYTKTWKELFASFIPRKIKEVIKKIIN